MIEFRNIARMGLPMAALVFGVACAGSQEKADQPMEEAVEAVEVAAAEMDEAVEALEEAVEAEMMTAMVGKAAPDFSLESVEGKTVKLSDYKGKTVVLEWFNPECPYIVYAHGEKGPLAAGNMKMTDDVVWLAINSNAEGKQGYGRAVNMKAKKDWGMSYPVLMDPTGMVGKLYTAKTTPHMFIVNPEGTLVYSGALDNAPRGEMDGDTKVNYVDMALKTMATGGSLEKGMTKPYGCGVKYEG